MRLGRRSSAALHIWPARDHRQERHGRLDSSPGRTRRHRNPPRWRQRRRCRHRHQRRDGAHGTYELRRRRRSLRHRMGCQNPPALRTQRERPLTLRRYHRPLPPEAPARNPHNWPAVVVGARLRRWLGRAAQAIRHHELAAASGPEHPICGGRVHCSADHRRVLPRRRGEPSTPPRRGGHVSRRWPRAGQGRALQEPAPRTDLSPDRGRRAR